MADWLVPEGIRVVLASGSPRRRELLAQLDVGFEVVAADIDETERPGEDPVSYVRRLAEEKAGAVVSADPDRSDAIVIAADTTVDVDGRILAKPIDAADARRMLSDLSGRAHQVHTGLAVARRGALEVEVVTTTVTFAPLPDALIDWYVGTGEPMDKAGAYAIQGQGAVLVERVEGSVTNVIGLPLSALVGLVGRVV